MNFSENNENDMTDGTQVISGKYVKQLYLLQKNESIKAVRNLTNKHINPSNFDKMNVGRAVLIFSPPVTAALQFLQEQSTFHPKAAFFKDAKATFLQNIYKWFSAHDVSSRHHYIISKNRLHFFSLDDERLQWLESDFLQYLLSIKQACNSHNPQLKFLSKETYDAIKLTTISTVECIKYLLLNGYHYVLTRSFNSDPIESLFSALRQMNGGNDAMDVKSTICSLEKILQTGMIISSKFSNVRKADCISSGVIKFQSQEKNEVNLPELPDSILSILDSIEAPLDSPPANLNSASIAVVGGYIVKCIEERHSCLSCLDNISSVKCPVPVFRLIFLQDNGNLRYPSPPFVKLLFYIKCFIEKAVPFLPQQLVSCHLSHYILPRLTRSPLLK